MELTFLGFNSALPTANKHSTSQLLKVGESLFLIDAGEGMQAQLRRAKVKFSKINQIFISHLHGDHVFGLIGFINSLNLLGREKPLHIFGPNGVKELIETQMKITHAHRHYPLVFNELTSDKSEMIYEDKNVEVHTVPLKHRVYCNGYVFKEKPKLRNLVIGEIEKYPEIERCDYYNLKLGKDFVLESGEIIPNSKLTTDNFKPMRYAFCSDTMFLENPTEQVYNSDVIYHESTFLHQDLELAIKTTHSTALQAANFAKNTGAKALFLGHFSNRYSDYEAFRTEAQTVFKNTFIPEELQTYDLRKLIDENLMK